jgi:hypothetical protein
MMATEAGETDMSEINEPPSRQSRTGLPPLPYRVCTMAIRYHVAMRFPGRTP